MGARYNSRPELCPPQLPARIRLWAARSVLTACFFRSSSLTAVTRPRPLTQGCCTAGLTIGKFGAATSGAWHAAFRCTKLECAGEKTARGNRLRCAGCVAGRWPCAVCLSEVWCAYRVCSTCVRSSALCLSARSGKTDCDGDGAKTSQLDNDVRAGRRSLRKQPSLPRTGY